MVRVFQIVVLALFIGQAIGLSGFVDACDECAQPCPGGSQDGGFCICCPAVRPAVVSKATAILPTQKGHSLPAEQTEAAPSPEPREILHVPKHILA